MSDFNPLGTDATVFRMHASGDDRTLSRVRSGLRRDGEADADLEKACEQFESLLLGMMIREMRATVPESGLLPESMAETLFTGMLDEQYAGEMAENGGMGLAGMIFNQLKGGR